MAFLVQSGTWAVPWWLIDRWDWQSISCQYCTSDCYRFSEGLLSRPDHSPVESSCKSVPEFGVYFDISVNPSNLLTTPASNFILPLISELCTMKQSSTIQSVSQAINQSFSHSIRSLVYPSVLHPSVHPTNYQSNNPHMNQSITLPKPPHISQRWWKWDD